MKAIFGDETAESYYDEGLMAGMSGDIGIAVEHFTKAIKLDSSLASAYHQLGKCYARLGNAKVAVQLLREVTHKRPRLAKARLDLAYGLIELGDFKAAQHQCEQLVAQNPNNAKAVLGLAHVSFAKGNWRAALTQAQAAQAIGGANFAVSYMIGRSAKLAGDTATAATALGEADKIIEKSLDASKGKPEGHYLRGEVAFVLDKLPAALEHYRDAEDNAEPGKCYLAYGENFRLADVLAKQGLCLQRLEKIDRAREIGERIRAIDPSHPLGKALRES